MGKSGKIEGKWNKYFALAQKNTHFINPPRPIYDVDKLITAVPYTKVFALQCKQTDHRCTIH